LESGNYVLHRLKQVGWSGDPSFPMSAIGAIHQHTGGIPRRINALGNRLMILGYLDELHSFSAEDVNRVASDLANENEPPEMPAGAGAVSQPGTGDVDALTKRLNDVEERLAKQEAFTRRAGQVIQQLLGLLNSDPV
jgi:hypothetical protein